MYAHAHHMFICVQTHTHSCPYSPTYMHTLWHSLTYSHYLFTFTLLHFPPWQSSLPANGAEVLEAPGYLWHCSIPLEPCTASRTWWNALTTCGINKCTHDQVGDNLGSLGLWVCVGSELGTGEWVQICSLTYRLHDLGVLCNLSEPSPTLGTNRDSQGTYLAVVRTDRSSAQSWGYWPHSVWDVASQASLCPKWIKFRTRGCLYPLSVLSLSLGAPVLVTLSGLCSQQTSELLP